MAKARTNRTRPSTFTVLTLVASAVSAGWAAAIMTPAGRVAYVYVFTYAEFYLGVIALVALSVTIMTGLVATDRLVLSIRQRVLAQFAHRTAGLVAVAALALHVGTKVAEGHARPIDAVVPFLAPGPSGVYLGLGTIAGLVMILLMWTGVVRARFAGRGRPWVWRLIHVIAYPMWPLALVHGLAAGRRAAPWVVACYVLCVLGVVAGLAVRISAGRSRRGLGAVFVPPSVSPSVSPFVVPSVAPSVSPSRSRSVSPSVVPAVAPALSPSFLSAAVAALGEARPLPALGRARPVAATREAPPVPAAADARSARVVASHAVDPNYLPPDETPTLVDLAGRRARKNEERRRDGTHATVPGGRRPRRRADDASADIEYWRRIRREAR